MIDLKDNDLGLVKNVRLLSLDRLPLLTNIGLEICKNIQELCLSGCPGITDEGIILFASRNGYDVKFPDEENYAPLSSSNKA